MWPANGDVSPLSLSVVPVVPVSLLLHDMLGILVSSVASADQVSLQSLSLASPCACGLKTGPLPLSMGPCLCRWTTLACVAATPALEPLWSTWTWWQMHGQVSLTMSRGLVDQAALHMELQRYQISGKELSSSNFFSKLPLMPVACLPDRQLQALQQQWLALSLLRLLHASDMGTKSPCCMQRSAASTASR